MTAIHPKSKRSQKVPIGLFCLAVLIVFTVKCSPLMQTYSLGVDPSFERCLPEIHLTLLKRAPSPAVHRGDLVFFKPDAHFTWVKRDYILKKVAGIEGDHLVIKNDKILINDQEIVHGFPLALYYKRVVFTRDEIIPKGEIFLYGTHAFSDDSRYWGFESIANLEGTAYVVF